MTNINRLWLMLQNSGAVTQTQTPEPKNPCDVSGGLAVGSADVWEILAGGRGQHSCFEIAVILRLGRSPSLRMTALGHLPAFRSDRSKS
jgi:hypothetical protein